jgi:hypothetical protein
MAVLQDSAVFGPLASRQKRALRVGESNAADNHDDEQRRNDRNRDPLDVHEASMRPPSSVGFGTRVHMTAAVTVPFASEHHGMRVRITASRSVEASSA